MTELFLKIEEAENLSDTATEIFDAICELSKYGEATSRLLADFRNHILAKENLWREIETRVDYQAKYTSREQARADFLKGSVKQIV